MRDIAGLMAASASGMIPPPATPPGSPPPLRSGAPLPERVPERVPPPPRPPHEWWALVTDACPALASHPPLASVAAAYAPLPETIGDGGTRAAVAAYLASLRRAFLGGEDLPSVVGLPPEALRLAVTEDILAGARGLLGVVDDDRTSSAFAPDSARPRARPPETLRGPLPDALARFFREGRLAERVRSALEGPPAALVSAGARSRVTLGAREGPVDFGLQRRPPSDAARPSAASSPAPGFAFHPSACASAADWAGDDVRTRHALLVNEGDDPVLLLAVTTAPYLPGAIRARCDHPHLARHPADTAPPPPNAPIVVLPPGASYHVSVDVRVGACEDGCAAWWLLAAVLEIPAGWRTPNGGFDVEPRDWVRAEDVFVVGRRVAALVVRDGARAERDRAAELRDALDAEAPKFVPRRLREVFDHAPTTFVEPPFAFQDEDKHYATTNRGGVGQVVDDVSDASDDASDDASAAASVAVAAVVRASKLNSKPEPPRLARSHPETFAAAAVPAAYLGPRGVGALPTFARVFGDGVALPSIGLGRDAGWDAAEREVANASRDSPACREELSRWIRALRVEELQQASDAAKFDLHDAVLTRTDVLVPCESRAGASPSGRASGVCAAYRLNVPGLAEGCPPAAKLDVLRLRVTATWTANGAEAPRDAAIETGALVVRVVPRAEAVLVVLNPFFGHCDAARCHVRFSHDLAMFRAQRVALAAASRDPATRAMLVPRQAREDAARRTEEEEANNRDEGNDGDEGNGGDSVGSEASSGSAASPSIPTPIPSSPSIQTPPRIVARLNAEQLAAVEDVLRGRASIRDARGAPRGPPYCVLGPPGTGKTMTVVAAATAVLATQPDARVLLCAPAAFAADVICSRMAEWSAAEASVGAGAALAPSPDPRRHERGGEKYWSRKMARVNDPRRELASVKADVVRFCVHPDSAAARRARVVVTSCASAGVLADAIDDWTRDASADEKGASTLGLRRFTHIFVDEAGQATAPETLVPMRLASGSTRAVVLAGDPRQLGPVVHSSAAATGDGTTGRGLTASLLEIAAGAHDDAAKTYPRAPRRVVRLVNNYRSHDDIIALPSRLFYDKSLVAAASEASTALPASLVDDDDSSEDGSGSGSGGGGGGGRPARVLFCGVRGAQVREGNGDAPSYFNPVEAQALVDLVESWVRRGEAADEVGSKDFLSPSDVGVMAPYRAQVLRVRAMLRARGLGAVRVGTVDDYQGQEERVVFISTTMTRAPREDPNAREEGSATARATRLGFLACPRRFCVAVTRAKALNVIVGHPAALDRWPHWRALLRHCVARGAYVGAGAERIPRVGRRVDDEDEKGEEENGERTNDEEDDDGYEALAAAIGRVAEASLLGGGYDGFGDDASRGNVFEDGDSRWRVAM